MTIKEIEKTWRDNFRKSPLVRDGVFNSELARQLFYGFEDDSDAPFKQGFRDFNDHFDFSEAENQIEKLLEYLHYLGLSLLSISVFYQIEKKSKISTLYGGTLHYTFVFS
jgi:hypothetical protein